MTVPTDPVIQTRGLGHRFRRSWALRDVDLDIPQGALYALLGPNGAGKTTLLKILMGLLRPSTGQACLGGVPISSLSTGARTRIGYVAEGQALPGWMTLRRLESYVSPMYPTWDFALADQLRDRFRLPSTQRISRMSRGEQMKVALLVTLAARPEILIMDEPFTGMDALVKDEIVYGLLELAQDGRWTVLLCSHDIGQLENLADWVGFLDRGRLILSEPADVLRSRFAKVDVTLRPGTLTDLGSLPPTWLSAQRSGNRLTFVTCERGVEGWEGDLRANLPGVSNATVQPASMRDVFVALAAEGLGGRDWERDGGLA